MKKWTLPITYTEHISKYVIIFKRLKWSWQYLVEKNTKICSHVSPLFHTLKMLIMITQSVAVHGRDLYLVKPTLGPQKKFQHLIRAEEVVITRLRIGHTKATKSYILSRGPPTGCHHCGQTLTIDHMLLECALLSWWILHSRLVECFLRDNTWDLHSGIPARSGFLLSDMMCPHTLTMWSDLSNC